MEATAANLVSLCLEARAKMVPRNLRGHHEACCGRFLKVCSEMSARRIFLWLAEAMRYDRQEVNDMQSKTWKCWINDQSMVTRLLHG